MGAVRCWNSFSLNLPSFGLNLIDHQFLERKRNSPVVFAKQGVVYVRAIVDGKLAGNAFAFRWTTGEKNVLWITQLLVDRSYRERGIARRLLDHLVEVDIDIYGLMSSHPAACVAAARIFATSIGTILLDCTRRSAEKVMKSSPVPYVKDAKLRGSVFDPYDTSGLISSVDTGFFVDHTEPLEALGRVKQITTCPFTHAFINSP
ncbi:uncharacterized protein L3040_009096 [Drepanopeziza brunnea f. sp. 'multigermtubi']|uniref:N-acetyltransferase domain-containing protein n=1 Tax=Marssonina brunnea f. sp. multigermtubi (strain MB_m1) TaxID=1072389 RepID=K1WRB9_MARBU|nr:uncharacterized protein MBM_06204 [Drepanopeziza brunnea f. sp. 'multigermtubi' MB_m1]EKD15576.1 hypothetical protein MBM_06204 [Drepanopeziza brunnea f. sp. 'multigermtubi' MB_m1]KAJ5032493.1 hypothetical protein L3040_009096 [Drepanopeziza brunnea f. sp. 'multigermtubi']